MIGFPVQPSRIEASSLAHHTINVFPARLGKQRNEPLGLFQIRIAQANIKDEFEAILQAWFACADKARDTLNLFFGAFGAITMFDEFRYLALIQAVEAYSRVMASSDYVTAHQYDSIRLALTNAIPIGTPQNLKSSLKNRIKYGNEFSLRKRLNELIKSLEPDSQVLICEDRISYVERVVSTRNYLTHYTSELREQAWPIHKMYYASQSLIILLSILIYRDIGFSEHAIRNFLLNHSYTKQTISIYKAQL